MKETLEFLIKKIVTDGDKVKVDEDNKDGYSNLTVSVSENDMGTVIGREGKIIRALRNLMKIKAIVDNKRINIELNEGQKAPTETPPLVKRV